MLEAGIGCFNQKYLKAFKCVAHVGPDRKAHTFQIILYFSRDLGKKMYELSNHLGNVLTTVSDIKLTADGNTDGVVDSYAAVITSAQDYYTKLKLQLVQRRTAIFYLDNAVETCCSALQFGLKYKSTRYYPFGSLEMDRTYSSENYRFGFNGKENDNEVKGTGNSVDFGARMYDSRLGRWMACDPKGAKYPGYSPYHFGYCNPIVTIDPNGEENVVVVGGQPKTKKPVSDRKNPFWGQEAKGHNKRHFLEKGLNEAIRLKENNTENGEGTTIIVFKSDYKKAELEYYAQKAHDNGIDFIVVDTKEEIQNYIGWKDTEAKIDRRHGYNEENEEVLEDDKITDFAYVGHGNEDALWIGYGGNYEAITITEICPDAFAGTGEATLWGCNNGNDGGIAFQFVDGGYVKQSSGYEGTAWWGEDKDGNQGVGLVRDDDQPDAPMRVYGSND